MTTTTIADARGPTSAGSTEDAPRVTFFGTLLSPLLAALDRPAREAALLARRPLLHTFARAAFGLAAVAAAAVVAMLLASRAGPRGAVQLDALRAALEALAVVLPATIVVSTSARLRVSPRTLIAAAALGLVAAGIMCASLVPLMAYIALIADGAAPLYASPALAVPVIALAVVASAMHRILKALDGSARAALVSRCFMLALFLAFTVRAWPSIARAIHAWSAA